MIIRPEIDLRLLYYFIIVAEEKHFGRAAKRIGIQQPPLSLQIKKLEAIVGAKLFDRSNKKIKLTHTGTALLIDAHKLLDHSSAMTENIRRVVKGEAGILKISFASSTIFSGIPLLIERFKRMHPGIKVELKELHSSYQMDALLKGTADVGFVREALAIEGIRRIPFHDEAFVLAFSSRHPLSRLKKIKLKDVQDEPFIFFPKEIAVSLYNKILELFRLSRFEPRIVQEANEWQTIISLVEANLGVSICPASFKKIQVGKIIYREIAGTKTKTSIQFCYNENNLSPSLFNFLSVIESMKKVNSNRKIDRAV